MTGNKTILILAGGFGTRLSKVVADVPKPLAPVNGKPFLYYILEKFIEQGINDFVFLVHHKADQIIKYIEAEHQSGILKPFSIRFVEETEPLGTGGAVANAVRALNLQTGFAVANADTWLSTGINEIWEQGSSGIAVLAVEDTSRYGKVIIENGNVVSFEEKKPDAGPGLINAGLYYFRPEVFDFWSGSSFSMETDLFPQLVKQKQLKATEITGEFTDIGVPEDYYRFCSKAAS